MQDGGLVMTVYVDVIILVNLVMDFFILWAAGKLAGQKIRLARLLLGALLGAAYSLTIFFPENTILASFVAKVACSLIMVAISYAPVCLRSYLRTSLYFYLTTFAMGGAVFAAFYLSGRDAVQVFNGVAVYQDGFNYNWLTVGIAVAVLIGSGGVAYIKKNWIKQDLYSTITIIVQDKKKSVRALLDTGNQLYDPLTKRAVLIVETQALRGFLPQEMACLETDYDDVSLQQLSACLEPGWIPRLHLIPFNSVGRKHGLLIAFRPDIVEIRYKDQFIRREDLVVGLHNGELSREGHYQALLHPDVFN